MISCPKALNRLSFFTKSELLITDIPY